jgi:hypothetical protein
VLLRSLEIEEGIGEDEGGLKVGVSMSFITYFLEVLSYYTNIVVLS